MARRPVAFAIVTTVIALVASLSVAPAAVADTGTGSFTGMVSLDSTGHPATSGKVTINYTIPSGAGEVGYVTVNPDGSFAITGLAPGQYSFRVHDDSGVYEDGFPLASLNGAMSPVRPTSPEWITVAAGQSISLGELVMTPWGVASGHVTVHGQPASSDGLRTWTSVNLYYQLPGSTDWTFTGFDRTDVNGDYRITTVPRTLGGGNIGHFKLTAEPVNTDQFASATFDDISSSMNIDLPFVSRISGTVYNGSVPAVANEVNLRLTSGGTTLTTTTDGNSSYLFNDVPNGTWHLTAAYANGSGQPVSKTVVLASNSLDIPTTTLSINLAPAGSLFGQVEASLHGNPLAGIDVDAYEYDANTGDYVTTFTAVTDAQGDYSFLDLPRASYGIQARDPAQVYATMEYDNESPYYQPDSIPVDNQPVYGLDFALPLAAHLTGTVHGASAGDLADGDVMAEVEVQDFSGGDPVWFETGDDWPVNSDGTFDVGDLPPDNYRLKFSDDADSRYAAVTTPAFQPAEGQTIDHIDVTMGLTPAGGYVSLTPSRLLDTRSGVGAPARPVAPLGVVTLQVAGRAGVPDNVSAVVLNVTVAGSTSSGFITVWADGATRPTTSSLNFLPGQIVPNLVIAPVGENGKVDLYNGSPGSTSLLADVAGYYVSGTPTATGAFGAVTPSRLLDTRSGVGAPAKPVAPLGNVVLQVGGKGGVPSDASAVVLNVTVAGSTSSGFITVWGGGTRPTTSSLNFLQGQIIPNLVIVPLSSDGTVTLYNGSPGSTSLLADVAGYFRGGTDGPLAPGALGALAPARLLDTRSGVGAPAKPVAPLGVVRLKVTGRGGVPDGATAVVLNVTVAGSTSSGFITVWADNDPAGRPTTSSLNFLPGQIVPNLVIAPVSAGGYVDLYNGSPGSTSLVADVAGWFAPG